MRRIKYPDSIDDFKEKYVTEVFGDDLDSLQEDWNGWRNDNLDLGSSFPADFKEILKADYSQLVDYYIHFKNNSLNEQQFESLNEVFNYEKYQPDIANFFMKRAEELDITTCFYCETAYINTYTVDDYNEQLMLLNTLPDEKLKKLLRTKSDRTIERIKRHRTFESKEKFNEVWHGLRLNNTENKFDQIFVTENNRNHFDLDHALDKGRCPLVALSVMNFVPSCQVCNEKLKRTLVLGDIFNDLPIEHLSPTSPNYDFYNQVKISLDLNRGDSEENPTPIDTAYAEENPDRFTLNFTCRGQEYENILRIFRLRERYSFHKMEGLHWLAKKAKYTDTNIKMLASSLKTDLFSESRLKEDIFQREYDAVRHPCFMKLKNDILSSS